MKIEDKRTDDINNYISLKPGDVMEYTHRVCPNEKHFGLIEGGSERVWDPTAVAKIVYHYSLIDIKTGQLMETVDTSKPEVTDFLNDDIFSGKKVHAKLVIES